MYILVFVVLLILLIVAALNIFVRRPSFGRKASGERLQRMRQSPNYRNGEFQNLSKTPALTEGATYWGLTKEFFFTKHERPKPSEQLPAKKEDLLQLEPTENVLVWFGHSSYFMQVDGKTFLVDPVFSGHASPVNFTTPAFKGTDVYTADDLPAIDYLLLTHDHWDHLDYRTVKALKPKVNSVITGLGVGAHLERWGYEQQLIIEKDWHEEIPLHSGFVIHTAPARHFSGRGLRRNNTLWSSFVLITPKHRIYIGGDSGYDEHFKTIGDAFGPFDLAILENGQYDKSWKYIHMMPEEVVQAARDLRAAALLPVHWSKFQLGNHSWNEPIIRVTSAAKQQALPILHPLIGEKLQLFELPPRTAEWWANIT